MIKVPGTPFFLEAVISFSKEPHLTATQTSVLSGILFDGHFIPQNWSILEFQQSKLAASIAFCCRYFLLNPPEITYALLWTYVAFFCLDKPEKRRFLCWLCTDWSAPPRVHTIFQQVTFRERIGSKRGLDTNETRLKGRGGGGGVSVYTLPSSLYQNFESLGWPEHTANPWQVRMHM